MQAPSWADVDQAVLSAVHSCVCWNFPGRDDNALETSQALQSMRSSAILAFASLEIDTSEVWSGREITFIVGFTFSDNGASQGFFVLCNYPITLVLCWSITGRFTPVLVVLAGIRSN